MYGTKAAAAEIYRSMQEKSYSTETWSQHELHPKMSEGFDEVAILNFVFTMDLLNFSFWSELSSEDRYQVEYRGKRWTGYNSLVASLRRALDEGIPITTPRFWRSQRCSDETIAHVFRSATAEPIPLLQERISILREVGDVLRQDFAGDGEDEDEDEAVQGAVRDTEPPQPSNITNGELDEGSEYIESLRADIDGPTGDRPLINAANTQPAHGVGHQGSSSMPQPSHPQIQTENVDVDASISHDRPEIVPDSGLANNTITHSTDESQAANDEQPAAAHTNSSHIDATSTGHITNSDTTHVPEPQQDSVRPDHAVVRLIQRADRSAGKLVNLLAHHFPSFRDECRFEGRKVRLLKRAQIFVADFWAALNGTGLGEFYDIDHLTMFADYRVPQVLHSLGVLAFSPPLGYRIQNLGRIESGHTWETQLRIWAVELIRREIVRAHPEATNVNAVLIDFFLYDLAKEREALGVPREGGFLFLSFLREKS
ncbi:hypothetical protein PRZ48_014200 [Zasmidium cellare]|uniref:Queuosine 5'-phosphate N-glycosylase/hydrolase n=1 Tax=Zasmidium cellare TaxID=395010 RepID=A0ABR0E0A9_ZASCE|nr:hypothetical protein PRZ48_014200 [Zasmidium cellare]